MNNLLSPIRLFFRQSFCRHSWQTIDSQKYAVVRDIDRTMDGTVTILFLKCEKCGKKDLIPTDRTVDPA